MKMISAARCRFKEGEGLQCPKKLGTLSLDMAILAKNKLVSAMCVLLFAACLAPVAAAPAFADGGVHYTGIYFGSAKPDAVPPEPHLGYLAVLEFDKNVSFANDGRDDAFIQQNIDKVHVRRAWDGTEVGGFAIKPGGTREERQLIYINNDEWPAPITAYEIVMEPGIAAANGQDVTDREYVVTFTTGPQCENGLSIYQNVGIPVGIALLVAGAVVQAVRVHRRRA